jgi:hypothetical protein
MLGLMDISVFRARGAFAHRRSGLSVRLTWEAVEGPHQPIYRVLCRRRTCDAARRSLCRHLSSGLPLHPC